MDAYVTGSTIKELREKQKMTQKQLADAISVSDKAVSKWETGKGLPDISLLEPLAGALRVSVAELLSGACAVNKNRCGNLLNSRFYVCPVCGNIIHAVGEGSFSCCGISLPPLEAEPSDELHIERIETDYFVSLEHPMEKEHFISFMSLVTGDRVQLVKLYPEQNAETRFYLRGSGKLYWYCNRHGLFTCRTPR